MKPEMIWAATSMSTCKGKETWLSYQFRSLELLKDETGNERWLTRCLITVLTNVTNTSCLLSPGVKHGSDDQKSRHDGTFTYSENETSGKEIGKVLAGCMTT